MGDIAGMLSATQGYSTGFNDSAGGSASSYYNVGESYSDSVGSADAWSKSDASSWGNSESNSWSRVYGSEATAKDIELAKQQNALQRQYWEEANAYNMTEAEKDRAFQQYMSNTSYQRAVADLIAAGLNPILAAGNSGASTPVGAMATTSAPSAYRANVIADQASGASARSASGSQSKSRSESHAWNESHGGSYQEGGGSGSSWNSSHGESNSEWGPQYMDLLNNAVDYGNNLAEAITEAGKKTQGGSAKIRSNEKKGNTGLGISLAGAGKWASKKPSGHTGTSHKAKTK